MDRFDLEERIADMANVEHELDLIMYKHSDSTEPATEDELLNMLIGCRSMCQVRYERLFDCFSELVKQGVITNKNFDTCSSEQKT